MNKLPVKPELWIRINIRHKSTAGEWFDAWVERWSGELIPAVYAKRKKNVVYVIGDPMGDFWMRGGRAKKVTLKLGESCYRATPLDWIRKRIKEHYLNGK